MKSNRVKSEESKRMYKILMNYVVFLFIVVMFCYCLIASFVNSQRSDSIPTPISLEKTFHSTNRV